MHPTSFFSELRKRKVLYTSAHGATVTELEFYEQARGQIQKATKHTQLFDDIISHFEDRVEDQSLEWDAELVTEFMNILIAKWERKYGKMQPGKATTNNLAFICDILILQSYLTFVFDVYVWH